MTAHKKGDVIMTFTNSFMKSATYDLTDNILTITFVSGAVHNYSVGQATVDEFYNAESRGSFFNKRIRPFEV